MLEALFIEYLKLIERPNTLDHYHFWLEFKIDLTKSEINKTENIIKRIKNTSTLPIITDFEISSKLKMG